MAWTATLVSLSDPSTPDGSKLLTVTYSNPAVQVPVPGGSPDAFNTVPMSFTRSYQLTAGNFQTVASVQAFIQQQIANLSNLDNVVLQVNQTLGQSLIGDGRLLASQAVVNNIQLRIQLIRQNQFTAVDNLCKAQGTASEYNQIWEYGNEFRITSDFIKWVQQQRGYTDNQLKNFFINAMQISV